MDFKNTDIAGTPVITDLGSADAAASLEAAAALAVAMQAGNIMPLSADGQLVLPAGVGLDDIKVVGRDLVIQMPDGTQMIVPEGAVFVPQIVVDGVAVPPLNIAALLIGQEPEPAAGRPQSSGGNFADAVGDIGDPFALGDLLPPTQLAFPEPEEREIVPGLIDEEPTTIIITPDQPAGSVNATASVQEAALPARGSEPSGSNPSSNAETTTGTIVFDAPDGLGSITLNGVAVTAIGQTFVTPLGTLTITSIAPGAIGYSYTLTDNTTSPASNDVFAVEVTDSDGDAASANLTINIVDDAPTARNDTDAIAAGTYGPQTGNVVTGAGTTSGAAGADTPGADGAVVSGVRAGNAGNFGSVGTTVIGQYGTLTLNADGSYSYTRSPNTPGGVTDTFSYQITDGDGDTSTATLVISIGDSPATVISVPTTGGGTIVEEEGLPPRGTESPGSNDPAPVESTSGTIGFAAPDGVATVQINGITVTGPGQVINLPTGTFTVTSYDPVGGTLGYTFTLTDNTSGDSTTQVITVTVTDIDGDSDSEPFTITIVDDTPTARNDSATQSAENAPITVNVFANDTPGADGVSLTSGVAVVAGTLSGAGTLTYNGDGTFTYTPAPGEEGTVTFQYTITDGDGDPSTATVSINLLEDSTPALEIGGERLVDEAGLPARGSEPAGSDAASNSETTTGSIAVSTGSDSVQSLVINGVNVTSGGTITGAHGTLTISVSAGAYSYSYTLTDNTSGDATTDSFDVVLTDSDGDSATDTLVIDIVDDVPTAANDTDSLLSGATGPATGNVLTDAEGDGGADSLGADGGTVTRIDSVNVPANFDETADGSGNFTVAGQYGTLTINADGTYSYTRNNGAPLNAVETFSYTVTDGDGDTAQATLEITIQDAGVVTGVNATVLLDDDALAGGNPGGIGDDVDSANATGFLTGSGGDGALTWQMTSFTSPIGFSVALVNPGLLEIRQGGTLVFSITLNTATGEYTLTQVAPIDQAALGDENNSNFSLGYRVTDADGDQAFGTLSISIDDDTSVLVNDTDSLLAGATGPATGNVLTDAEGDGGADSLGADGGTVTRIDSVNVPANFDETADGSGNFTVAGQYGTLTINADGTYSYTRNNGAPLNAVETFSYTVTDGDGDTAQATLEITIQDAGVVTGANATVLLDDDALAGGNPGGIGDDVDSANATGFLTGSGGDGALTWTMTSFTSPGGFNVTLVNPGLLEIRQGATLVFSITLNNTTGEYTVTQVAPIDQVALLDENNSGFSLGYRVTDADGDQAFGTLSINIDDDTPVVSDDTDTILNGSATPATGNVLTDADAGDAGDSDTGADSMGADGGSVTRIDSVNVPANFDTTADGSGNFTVAGEYGVLTINADGSYSYVRNSGSPGNVADVFNYTVTDGDGDTAQAKLTIAIEDARPIVGANATVLLDDDAVVGANGNPNGTGDDADAANVAGTLSGSGGDGALTWAYQLGGAPAGFSYVANGTGVDVFQGQTKVLTVTLNSSNGAYTVTQNAPIAHATGADENNQLFTLTYTVTDVDGDSTPGTLTINVDDDSPLAVNDGHTTIEGAPAVTGNVLTNDPVGADAPGTVTLVGAAAVAANTVIVGAYGTLTISSDGSYSYLPKVSVPTGSIDSFTYTMRDADGDIATATLTFTFNGDANLPSAGTTSASVDDDALGGNAGGIDDLTDPNTDGDNNHATFSGNLPLNFGLDGAGKVTFAHLDGLFGVVGTEGVQYSWNEATSTLTATGPRGALFTVVVNQATGAYTLTLLDNVLHNGGANENNATGVLTYVVHDSDGSTTPGTLNIVFDDDTPVAVNDVDSVTEDGTTTADGNVFTGSGGTDANGTDGNADSIGADGAAAGGAVTGIAFGANVGAVGSALNGAYGALTLNANGSYSYVLNNGLAAVQALDSGEVLTEIFTYTIRDGDGDTTTATVTITINGANDAPVANPDTNWVLDVTTGPNPTATGNVLQNLPHNGAPAGTFADVADTDVDVEPLTVTTTGTFNGTYGTLVLNANGSYTYTLNANNAAVNALDTGETLIETFNYTASDGTASAGATLTITIFGTNDAPVVNPDTNWVLEDGANATGNVLQNVAHPGAPSGSFADVADTDVDVEPLTVTPAVIVGTYGTLTLNANGSYTYVLNNANPAVQALDTGDAPLTDSFNYTASDGTASAGSTLTISIFGTNDAPVVGTATARVSEEGLANGRTDAVGSPDDLTNSVSANGTISITDVDGEPQTVTLGDPGAVLTADGLPVTWTGVGTGSLTGRVETSPGVFVNVITVTINNSGNYTVTLLQSVDHPTINVEDLKTFTVPVSVNDGTVTVPTTLTVVIEDDSPTAVNDGVTTIEGAAASVGNVLGNDFSGADTPAVVVSMSAGALGGPIALTYGTLTLNADGSYTYTPNASVPSGSVDSVTYTMRDADGDTSTATLTFTFQGDANTPTGGTVAASVDDDALAGGIAAGTGDLPDANADGDNNQATFSGALNFNFGPDGAGSVNFAAMHNVVGSVGAETVLYSWNAGTNTLTATINAGARSGTQLFKVEVTNPTTTGNYKVTLLDNVIHTAGSAENDATAALTYNVTDSDNSATTGTLNITFDDDSPTLGVVQNQQANNNPAQTPAVGTLHFAPGADGAGSAVTITANTTGLTAGGLPVLTSQTGNVLTGYVDTNGTAGYQAGVDTEVFTLTVNPTAGTSGQYVFDLKTALDPTVTDVPIGSGSSFGVGPSDSVIVTDNATLQQLVYVTGWSPTGGFTPAEQTAWQGGASPTVTQTSNVNGSTQGWGLGNNNFDPGEFLRFDFGALNDYDGAGGYTPPGGVGPMATVSYATFSFFQFTAGETIKFVAHYVNGSTQAFVVDGATDTGSFTISAPAGTQIAWIDVYQSDGDMKLNLTNVGVAASSIDKTIPFTVQLSDGDGDLTSTNAFTVRVSDGLTPFAPAAPVVLDLDGDGAEFLAMSAGVAFDYAGDGSPESTAWVGADDALLALDKNGDGLVNDGSEIVFASGNLTDLQGLAANYDSNGDGLLTAADSSYALFGVWQDANSNGVTDAGEYRSLSEVGIVSIGLVSDGIAYGAAGGEVSVAGQSAYTKSDGTTGVVADAAFATGAMHQAPSRSSDQIRSGNLTMSVVAASLVGLAVDANPVAAFEGDGVSPGHVVSEFAAAVEGQDIVFGSSSQIDFGQPMFETSQDFVQRFGDAGSTLRAVEEPDFLDGLNSNPISTMSDLLADSGEPLATGSTNPLFAFGGDNVMHSMLDIAALAPAPVANDNGIIELPLEDAVRQAMPDLMVDRLIDAFAAEPGLPANDVGGGAIDGDRLLTGMLDQGIDAFHISAVSNTDILGSHHYDMSTSNN